MKVEGQVRIPSGCAIAAVISKEGNRMSGEEITNAMKPMHDRSNGLGGGFAGYGIYPEYKEFYALHMFFDSRTTRKECEEGKMFLIPQIWAVFSGVSRMGRETVAMDAVEKYLSDPLGTVISSPAYTKWDENIGFTFISVLFLSGLNKKKRRSSQCRVSSTLK